MAGRNAGGGYQLSDGTPASLATATTGGGTWIWSPLQHAGTATDTAGDFTVGCGFKTSEACRIAGIRFKWAGSAGTVRCRIYSGGSALATIDVPVTGAGIYLGTFRAVLITVVDTQYYCAIRKSTGASYPKINVNRAVYPTFPIPGTAKLIWTEWGMRAAGAAEPSNVVVTEAYPVIPTFA